MLFTSIAGYSSQSFVARPNVSAAPTIELATLEVFALAAQELQAPRKSTFKVVELHKLGCL